MPKNAKERILIKVTLIYDSIYQLEDSNYASNTTACMNLLLRSSSSVVASIAL